MMTGIKFKDEPFPAIAEGSVSAIVNPSPSAVDLAVLAQEAARGAWNYAIVKVCG